MSDHLRSLWAADAVEPQRFTPQELDRRARALHRRLWRRDAAEYAASVLVLGVFGWIGWASGSAPVGVACVAVMLGALVVCANLWRRRMPSPPATLGTQSAGFYRAELVRQRDSLLAVWKWYLAPFAPGTMLFVIANAVEASAKMPVPFAIAGGALMAGYVGAVFYGIHRLNRAAARKLDAEIAAVDQTTGTPF